MLERDRLFTNELRREATALELPVIRVDLGLSVDALAARVAEALGLATTVQPP